MTGRSAYARFEVRHSADSNHYYLQDHDWTVTERSTGQVVAFFSGRVGPSGGEGVREVHLDSERWEAVATHHDGQVERKPLPG